MERDLFRWDELLEACPEYFQFGDCVMLRDFGPVKEGERFAVITIIVDADKPVIEFYRQDADGEELLVHKLEYQLTYKI